MSWWSRLFKGKGEVTETTKALTYQELAARVEKLQASLDQERSEASDKRRRIASRARDDQALLARYRAALEFYADEQSWRVQGLSAVHPATLDRGHKARKALGRL